KHPQQEYLQVDTTNILFVCGGAFVGLEKIIEERIGHKSLGFGAAVQGRRERRLGEILMEVQPEDLLRYGLIPELIGRLPVVAVLHELDEKALMRILIEPRNALVKQYQKYFEFEGVKLTFTDDALGTIAREAVKRETGARGLRAILEDIMLDLMYEIPSQSEIAEVLINREAVAERKSPIVISRKRAESA
ncbi:MAG: AAA family ATPase, partial [candidate division NC10 bacterium]|nr:AAA family ATPase [candidate division NC10 bacterium]